MDHWKTRGKRRPSKQADRWRPQPTVTMTSTNLKAHGTDEKVDAERREGIPIEERHEKAKANEDHNMHVLEKRVVVCNTA